MSAEKQIFARVKPLAEEYGMFPQGGTVLCCVSGGADSMCLLHFLHSCAPLWGFTVRVCHMDHMTRPNSADDLHFVAQQCEALGVPFYSRQVDILKWAKEHQLGTEEAGRIVRYQWFEELAQQWDDCVIATAHNADDNAETMLLHLVRGTGLSGLGGIPPRRGALIRPLLHVPRTLIEAYLDEKQLPHVEDITNADPNYTPRNLLRHQVLPLLRTINPNLTDTLISSATSLRQDSTYLTAKAEAAAQSIDMAAGSVMLPISSITDSPAAIGARVVQMAVDKLSGDVVLTAQQRRAVLDLCYRTNPSGHVDLPGGMVAQRVYSMLVFHYPGKVEILPPTMLDFAGTQEIGPWLVTVQDGVCPPHSTLDERHFYLKKGSPILLRPRKTGDTLTLPHREGTKSLKKWLIELRVPEARRDLVPVLEQEDACAAVYGLGTHRDFLPEAGEPCVAITIREKERNVSQ